MTTITLEIPAIGGGAPVEVRRPPVTAEVRAQRAAKAASAASAAPVPEPPPTVPAVTPVGGVPAAVAARWEMEERALILEETDGRYQVVRQLGRGGMGGVYLARDVALHRLVALKVLRPEAGPDERERFRREARLAAQLSHPGIVPVHAYDESPRLAWLVMQYVAGESLADRLRARKRLAPDETRRILHDLAAALDHAHRHGVVHRDLKPENVLLERESGRALLADFGVAMRSWADREMTSRRITWGTPAYMSPEQALGEPDVDGRSDLYALGLIGFAMLTGRLPFTGTTPAALLASRLSSGAPRVRAHAPDTPADLAAIIERCLEPEPERRWRSAKQLCAALAEQNGRRRGWLARLGLA